MRLRACLAGLALLTLAACAAPREIRPPVDPMAVRGNILRLADREWSAFGGQMVFWEGDHQRIEPVGVWEDERKGSGLVAKYWRAVGLDFAGIDCTRPWSAAFISWVMAEAGVPADAFPPSALHADYLRAIVDAAAKPDARWLPHDITEYAPKPGDLICATRAGTKIAHFDDIPEDALLHCDIVVGLEQGQLASIGGNVRNSVSKSLRPVDSAGHLTADSDRRWFLVVENRYPAALAGN